MYIYDTLSHLPQDLSLELQLLEADIRALHDQGEQLAREGRDPEGQQAIQATLNILQDRYDTIKLMAQDKDTELQVLFIVRFLISFLRYWVRIIF